MTGTEGTLGVFVSLNTIITAWVMSKLRRIDTVEDRLSAALFKAMDERHAASVQRIDERDELTGKLIDERLRRITHDMNSHAQQNISAVGEITRRMDRAVEKLESTLDAMGEKDHEMEIGLLNKISKTQIEIAEKAATKADLKEHQESMSKKVAELSQRIDSAVRRSGN